MWAPEMCVSSVSGAPYSAFKGDVWAAGVILYAMVFGKLPFWDPDPGLLFAQIIATTHTSSLFEYSNEVSVCQPLQDLFEMLFVSDPSCRLCMSKCRKISWLQTYENSFLTNESVLTALSVSTPSTSTSAPLPAFTPGRAKYKRETYEDKAQKKLAKKAKQQKKMEEKKIKHKLIDSNGHNWRPKYFNKPTWCPICDDFVFGLTKDMQKAYKCRECKMAGHLKCVIKYNDHVTCTKCTASPGDGAATQPVSKISRAYNSDPVPNVGGHVWRKKMLKSPTWCKVCNSFIYGVTKEQQNAYRCVLCKTIGHRNCCEFFNGRGCSIGKFGVEVIKHNSLKKRPTKTVRSPSTGEPTVKESVCIAY